MTARSTRRPPTERCHTQLVRRLERRLFRLNDEIARLRRELELAEGELNMHRHLADDAERDAIVYEGVERAESRAANKDVAALERALDRSRRDLDLAEARRAELLRKLGTDR
jgi:hypothetical protein